MATLGERIKEALSIRKMKQADLVMRTGINKGALSCYISGRYVPKQTNTHKLAKALNVDEGWLMGKDVPMERTPLIIQMYEQGKFDNQEKMMDLIADCSEEEIDEIYSYAKYIRAKRETDQAPPAPSDQQKK